MCRCGEKPQGSVEMRHRAKGADGEKSRAAGQYRKDWRQRGHVKQYISTCGEPGAMVFSSCFIYYLASELKSVEDQLPLNSEQRGDFSI